MPPPEPTSSAPAFGPLPLGGTPWIVGTVTEEATFRRLADGESVPCDIVEIRLDQLGTGLTGWQDACRRIGDRVAPVLLTLRHAREGGAWDGPETERRALLRDALPVVQAIDTEISLDGVTDLARTPGRGDAVVIGSFHDFDRTPAAEDLGVVVQTGLQQGADVVKLACFIQDEKDEDRLLALVGQHTGAKLSVVGMGPRGGDTRVRFPCRGSCLTYGYLDRSAAPGQLHAGELRKKLAAACPAYAAAIRGD